MHDHGQRPTRGSEPGMSLQNLPAPRRGRNRARAVHAYIAIAGLGMGQRRDGTRPFVPLERFAPFAQISQSLGLWPALRRAGIAAPPALGSGVDPVAPAWRSMALPSSVSYCCASGAGPRWQLALSGRARWHVLALLRLCGRCGCLLSSAATSAPSSVGGGRPASWLGV